MLVRIKIDAEMFQPAASGKGRKIGPDSLLSRVAEAIDAFEKSLQALGPTKFSNTVEHLPRIEPPGKR